MTAFPCRLCVWHYIESWRPGVVLRALPHRQEEVLPATLPYPDEVLSTFLCPFALFSFAQDLATQLPDEACPLLLSANRADPFSLPAGQADLDPKVPADANFLVFFAQQRNLLKSQWLLRPRRRRSLPRRQMPLRQRGPFWRNVFTVVSGFPEAAAPTASSTRPEVAPPIAAEQAICGRGRFCRNLWWAWLGAGAGPSSVGPSLAMRRFFILGSPTFCPRCNSLTRN